MELPVHGCGIRPLRRVHVHLAHLRVVKPVDDEIVDGVVPVAITFGDGHKLFLAGITLLALYVSIRGLRQHRCVTCQQAVSRVNLIVGLACDDEKRDTLSNVGGSPCGVVEAEGDRCG